MTFPTTPLGVTAQVYLGGGWVDLENDGESAVFGGDRSAGVQLSHGRQDSTRDADAVRAGFDVENPAGAWTPGNPNGAYFGELGSNTPIRVGVTSPTTWLAFTGPDHGSVGATPASGARVTAPDSAALSITGDLDVRLDADLDTWHLDDSTGVDLVAKWTGTAGQKSWAIVLLPSGLVGFYWSNDGTTEHGLTSTAPLPVACGRLAVRVTIDVNNGAGGHSVVFYTSDSLTGTWDQLGDTRTGSGTTTIFDSTTAVTIGDTATGSQANTIRGRWYGVRILSGIAGTTVANPDFTAQTAGASSFADTASSPNTWTLTGAVALEDFDARMYGTVPSWQPQTDRTGNDSWIEVQAAGELARLQQVDAPLDSPMKRGVVALGDEVVAYWPCEDGGDASNFASGLSDGRPMVWGSTEPSLSESTMFVCSALLPTLSGSIWYAPITAHTNTGALSLQWLNRAPSAVVADDTVIISLWTRGSRWDVIYRSASSGSLQVSWYDSDGALISTSGALAFAIDLGRLWIQLDLETNGSDIDWTLSTLEVGAASGLTTSGTAAGVTTGSAYHLRVNRSGGITSSFYTVGHIVVRTTIPSLFDLSDQLSGFLGETAGARISRLCEEEAVQFTGYGDMSDTTTMGVQGRATLVTLLREAAAADGGILHEPPDRTGLAYRARTSMYSQPARLSLSYTGHDLSRYEPRTDDLELVNDVRVTRAGQGSPVEPGSSARSVLRTGRLSILPPAEGGMGLYAQDLDLNVETDAVLADHASWRLHLGTASGPRLEALGLELARSVFTAAERATVRALRVGDVVEVTNPPVTLGAPDTARYVVQGWSERLWNFAHDVTLRGSPAGAWDVLRWDDDGADWFSAPDGARYSSDGTTTAEALDTTETSIDVSTPTGPVWTHDDGDFDVMIGGERITVGGVTGTGASQTFTSCTRSVNGVVKSHDTGAEVTLFRPFYWGL